MNDNAMMLLTILVGITNIVAGFCIGKTHERVEWNKLIEKGIIRKPMLPIKPPKKPKYGQKQTTIKL